MPRQSAGLLPYRRRSETLEVLIAHPGGPYFTKKDEGAWTVAKGEYGPDEDALHAAEREFQEEIGYAPPLGERLSLGTIQQKGGKFVHVWAFETDDARGFVASNFFEIEWPPRSGIMSSFPEIGRAAWFDIDRARTKLVASQTPFLDRLMAIVLGEAPTE